MKIRNGFVSNSSSSSFILDGKNQTCVDVGIDMISQYYDWMIKEEYGDVDDLKKLKKIYIDRLNNLENKNNGIFYQTGEDIEISKMGNKIYVTALNGIDWQLDYESNDEFEEEIYDKIENLTSWYFPQIDNKHTGSFLGYNNPIIDKYKKQWIYSCENPDCSFHAQYLVKENKIFCPNCMTDPDGKKVIFRLEKLERILEEDDESSD